MPPGRTQPRRRVNPTTIVLSAVFAVVMAIVLVGAILSVASSGDVDVNVGGDSFVAGRTDRLAKQIDEGGPVLFPDASDARRRDVIIQHLGTQDDEGWLAIVAQPPGEDRECTLEWDESKERFEDCKGRSYPPDGGTQRRYRSRVEDGVLIVEFPKED